MRDNVILWWILTAFFALVGVVYTGWNILAHPDRELVTAIEWVGTVALFFTAFMSAMIAFYLDRTHRAQGGQLPEDILTADIDDGDPELGEFSPWSWWPIVLAGSAALGMIGLAVGQFLFPISIAIFVVAIVGWVYEYYRGNFAR
ncbi:MULTISPECIES: cytochrome c oxidase subunit 4 [Microbacterium]|uniref:cytochrome-c oxidase n=1 Tax=Microbacterium resistens TaxID=156977 RepID=A0ABY3RW44_9MICO|nr:cytochrome c oxidase subunit 4 [Microbacterium resistens]MBW1637636.1 cytochrome c oxidase subunit 4 [Microbacterium resistens]MDA4895894.1 cytochrome c oxidase subunit 4 [Streptomyces sp. MS2A]UGS27121.1 cytochrome c oxidase subunit 4 [Microbacterium resistens]